MKKARRKLNPVWLVFVPPALARGWLLFHTTTSSDGRLILAVNASLLLALAVLTWLFASDLADAAGLWQRAKERFMVMATLSTLAPPLSIAIAQTFHWGYFTVVQVFFLWGLRASFRLLSRTSASRGRWPAWILSCLLSIALWLIGTVSLPLASHFLLALSIPEWQPALLPLAQLWVIVVCLCAFLLAIGSAFLSFWWHHPLFLQLRKLVGGSLLFCGALAGLGALMSIMHMAPDGYIYILQALALTIPICNAAFFALPYMLTKHRMKRLAQQNLPDLLAKKRVHYLNYGVILHTTFLLILGLYFLGQLFTYVVTGQTLR